MIDLLVPAVRGGGPAGGPSAGRGSGARRAATFLVELGVSKTAIAKGTDPDATPRRRARGRGERAVVDRRNGAWTTEEVRLFDAPDVEAVRDRIRQAAAALGVPARGEALIAGMDARLAKAREPSRGDRALYLAPSGVAAGAGTFVDHLIEEAGLDNFDDRRGWRAIPLERLAYETPDVYAVPQFSQTHHNVTWTPFRHPIAVRRVQAGPTIPIDGATTSCGAWFLADAVEALAVGAAAN